MEYCLAEPQGYTRFKILTIQVLIGVALDNLNFCLYKTLCDYLKGFANQDKIMLSTVALNL